MEEGGNEVGVRVWGWGFYIWGGIPALALERGMPGTHEQPDRPHGLHFPEHQDTNHMEHSFNSHTHTHAQARTQSHRKCKSNNDTTHTLQLWHCNPHTRTHTNAHTQTHTHSYIHIYSHFSNNSPTCGQNGSVKSLKVGNEGKSGKHVVLYWEVLS